MRRTVTHALRPLALCFVLTLMAAALPDTAGGTGLAATAHTGSALLHLSGSPPARSVQVLEQRQVLNLHERLLCRLQLSM